MYGKLFARYNIQREPNIVVKEYSSWNILDVQLSFDVNLKLIRENELLFLNSIIGGGDGSRLQKEIREKMGLVYDIYSYVEIYNDAAVLSILFFYRKKELTSRFAKNYVDYKKSKRKYIAKGYRYEYDFFHGQPMVLARRLQ